MRETLESGIELEFDISHEDAPNILSNPRPIRCTIIQAEFIFHITKWPSSWFRFWTWVFFGAKWERID